MTILHWFRRDLRLDDNTALSAAARDSDGVVPVFVLDDHYARDPNVGPSRFRFLRESLENLEAALEKVGARLVVRRGPAAEALPRLLAETGAGAVYANDEIGPYPERRDREAAAAVEAAGATFRVFPDELVVPADEIATDSGAPYTAYTPFLKRWTAAPKRPPVARPARFAAPAVASVPLASVRAWRDLPADQAAPPGGEDAARARLDRFVGERLSDYARDRDFPARRGTSGLSPHLHFGTISARAVFAAVRAAGADAPPGAEAGVSRFLAELAWRDFFHHVLSHFPRVAERNFRREFDRLAWRENGEGLAAWKEGRTGFPFVDAAMRELAATHGMHNRARMVAASFLTKDLHLHWRHGESWFERQLADADLANNNGGWQWAAGTGTDAAPYFRIFHPVLQSRRFDPEGEYIRRFVPELSRVPASKIHEPWTMSAAEQRQALCAIGPGADYPAPILDHARERLVALRMFDAVKKGAASS
jgi:deoxyribodipyrimidine photo-lyase